MTAYHTLLGSFDGGPLEIIFGDYDRDVVEVKMNDYRDNEEERFYYDLQIITTDEAQEAIDARVRLKNRARGQVT